jgi:hypothetical protein
MQFGVLLVLRASGRRHQFQRHATLGAITRMILLHFRVHRTGINHDATSCMILTIVTGNAAAASLTILSTDNLISMDLISWLTVHFTGRS